MGDQTTLQFGHLRCEQCGGLLSSTGVIIPNVVLVEPSGPDETMREGLCLACGCCGQLRALWPEVQ